MSFTVDEMKKAAALAALEFVEDHRIIGIGTGTTINYFIDALKTIKHRLEGVVSSSKASTERLKKLGISVFDLNTVDEIPVYIDGADEINPHFQMIKGGAGALTGEKIVASVAKKMICIADINKKVQALGQFPIAIEVLPMARSYVGRELLKLGGNPVYRSGFITDHGNIIIDVHQLPLEKPIQLEEILNNITGTVMNGLFAKRPADVLLPGTPDGVVKSGLKT